MTRLGHLSTEGARPEGAEVDRLPTAELDAKVAPVRLNAGVGAAIPDSLTARTIPADMGVRRRAAHARR